MTSVTVGIDLAKNVLTVHGMYEAGKPALVLTTGHANSHNSATPCA